MTKHTILFLAANPVGTDRLALDEEARAIRVALERSRHRDEFQLEVRGAARPLDLLDELRKLKPTIVHFSGHGATGELSSGAAGRRDIAGEGAVAAEVVDGAPPHGLSFQGPEGDAQLVSTAAIQQTFGAAGASVKLVVLNACYSEVQAEALLVHVGCIVGMRGSILDDAARSFAVGFYGGLGERESVAAAYRQGCAAMGLEGLSDRDKPQLSVRDGVDAELDFLAELASGDPAARSRGSEPHGTASTPTEAAATPSAAGVVASPTPAYLNTEVQALSEQLEHARERKQSLRDAGIATDVVDREILELRRKLRDGGQLRAGDSLGDGRYLLVKPVGRGGFAVVWEAWDRADKRSVAIKVLHQHLANDSQRRERFFRGARVMMGLQHSAVVRVYDPRGEDETFCYFVMELVPGGNLRDAVLGQGVEAQRRLPIIIQVAEALAEAHRRQLVHRDVKPANILLDQYGKAKLTDFDLVGAHDTTGGTRTGAMGTVVYAAPECLDKPQEATARADVFGLGMTAIFVLSGRDLSMETFRNPAATVEQLDCSAAIQNALARAVDWIPELRFADSGAMVHALHAALDSSTQSVTVRRRRTQTPLAADERPCWAFDLDDRGELIIPLTGEALPPAEQSRKPSRAPHVSVSNTPAVYRTTPGAVTIRLDTRRDDRPAFEEICKAVPSAAYGVDPGDSPASNGATPMRHAAEAFGLLVGVPAEFSGRAPPAQSARARSGSKAGPDDLQQAQGSIIIDQQIEQATFNGPLIAERKHTSNRKTTSRRASAISTLRLWGSATSLDRSPSRGKYTDASSCPPYAERLPSADVTAGRRAEATLKMRRVRDRELRPILAVVILTIVIIIAGFLASW